MRVLQDIAYTSIYGYPLIFYLGILAYLFLAATGLIPLLKWTRFRRRRMSFHRTLALSTLVLVTAHGLLALSIYLG